MALSQALKPGLVLGRDFEIIRVLSQGGMGTVYEAVQRTTGAPRAVKVMRSAIANDGRFRVRFEQEARVSSRIPSDHVVQVVSAGLDEATGVPWIAMELLEGEDLATYLDRRRRMDFANARLAVEQLCHALAAAHAVGVVHRDLKPENIFLGKPRVVGLPFVVKVLDFGVAKIMSEARAATVAVGTPLYMAPEQTSTSAEIGPQADVWALGLVLFRLLTGCSYWLSGNGPEPNMGALWREVLIDPLPLASERARSLGVGALLPPGFDAWFSCCVAREVAGRYADAALAYAAFAPLLEAAPAAPAASRVEPLALSRAGATLGRSPATSEALTIAAS